MYSNKNDGPRRGRSFDSMNIGFDEKLLNNEVRNFAIKERIIKQTEGVECFKWITHLKTDSVLPWC